MDDVSCNSEEYPTEGKCPVCSRTFCIFKSGKLRAHKSNSFKCAGSGMEPLLPGHNLDFSADCTTKAMYNNRVWSSNASTVKRIPWSLRARSADLMSSLIQDALCYRSIESWDALICFPKLCLTSRQDGKSKRGRCTKKNIARGCKERGVRPSKFSAKPNIYKEVIDLASSGNYSKAMRCLTTSRTCAISSSTRENNQGDRLINEQRELGALSTEEAMPDMFAPMATSDETNYTNDDLDAVYSGAHSFSLTRIMSQTKNYADYLIIGGGASSVSAINVIKANDPNSKILMVSRDTTLPFHRSMLRRNMGECTVEQLDT
ncbi:hypothetical protein GJ496_003747 [Pomphorhynchus laevis]|nr:hypothetical protein GJ496_003747 [Pomphorhynchus laevis]